MQLMKSWITEIYSILDQEWPFLNFKMCIDGNTKGRETVDTLPEDVTYSYDALGSAYISRKGSRKPSRKASSLASPLSNPFSPASDSSMSPMPSPYKVSPKPFHTLSTFPETLSQTLFSFITFN